MSDKQRNDVITDIDQIQVNDVFRFRWHDGSGGFMPDHCFDGKLIAREQNGEILLIDTYWLSNNKRFSLKEDSPRYVFKKGKIRFVCNLDDIEKITRHEFYIITTRKTHTTCHISTDVMKGMQNVKMQPAVKPKCWKA